MLEFNGQYFASDQVDMIECSVNGGNKDYPFALSVCLRSGRKYTVIYQDEKARARAAERLARCIDNEKKDTLEKVFWKLRELEYGVNRVDKRQLRIWRQLKKLLSISEDGEGVEDT